MEDSMAKAETKVPVTTESKPESPLTATQMQTWRPFENLRREVDRLFEDFTLSPFRAAVPKAGVRHRAVLDARVLGRRSGGGFR